MTNPLLRNFLLPPFSEIEPKHIIPAINKILNSCYETVEKVIAYDKSYTWNNLCQEITEVNDMLNRILSIVRHLNAVKNSLELREIYRQTLLLLSKYNSWISQHKELYKAYCNLRNGKYYTELNKAQRKALDNTIRDFKLSGINLLKEKQKRYSEIVTHLSELSNQYSNNVLDATMSWTKFTSNKSDLSGIPENMLAIVNAQAKMKKQNGYLLTLDIPIYLSVMTYCDNQEFRKEIYYAYNTRASDQGPNAGKWDNGPIMKEILNLRYELAQILGFESYAHRSLATKMVKDTHQVLNFLTDLVKLVRPQAEREFAQLCVFAKTNFAIKEIQPWDIAYYSEKQKQYFYNINDEQIRPYFPENKVINGLFHIIKLVYGITVKELYNIDVWHPAVRFFELYDDNNRLCGSFYLDLYIRKNKRDGAWMDDCVNQMRKVNGSLQKPVAYLTCNFNCPINNKPALFTHSEVITLFHEFGHVLHHILTNVEVADISGINGIPWDAIELPSQFMENWCWNPEVLTFISGHYETGEPLSRMQQDKIIAAKNYQSAMSILRQLEFSLFDFQLHIKTNLEQNTEILEIMEEIKKQVAVIPSATWSRFPHTFSHIFAGGYAAGYYSYLWADVLASDAYSKFEEEGIFNRKTGQSFLNNILMCGGSEEPMELFKRFRGREPQLDAMLRRHGIKI